ncbi:MAG: serine hydrolase [Planctomycetota bacterium]
MHFWYEVVDVIKRMMVFVGFVCVPMMNSFAEPATELAKRLQPVIDAHEGDVGVAIKHLPSGAEFEFQADQPMPTASLIKLPILVALHDAVAARELDLASKLTLTEEDKVPGSGILTANFSPGTELSLQDAARLMIVFSDNTATNLVVDQIGLPQTAQLMQKLGCPETKLHAKVFRRDTSIFPERSREFGLGSTTAAEMVSLLERLEQGELINEDASAQIKAMLLACDDRTKIVRDLPSGVKVAHKTGAVSNARTDAGLIEGPTGPIAICVLTTNNKDRSWSDANAANVLCGRIARIAFDFFNPEGTAADDGPQELAVGADGELVEALQRTLNARLEPSPQLGVDGDFGPATRAAVIQFQAANALPESGVVNEQMWALLGDLITEDAPIPPPDEINSRPIDWQPPLAAEGPPDVTCKAWAIADASTGEVLWGSDEDQRLHPASTTKIMTGYLVAKLAEADPSVWDEVVTFTETADNTGGSSCRLGAGEQVSVAELLYGLLLPSGNDASVALAEHFGERVTGGTCEPNAEGNYEAFVAGMNHAATELGMAETHYENTHGLTHDDHLTSARDLVTLAHAAMALPEFRKRTSTVQRGATVGSEAGYRRNVLWQNTNRLLTTKGFDGVKTGTTSAAGACLVTRGERDGKQLLVVVLGSAVPQACGPVVRCPGIGRSA